MWLTLTVLHRCLFRERLFSVLPVITADASTATSAEGVRRATRRAVTTTASARVAPAWERAYCRRAIDKVCDPA